MNHQPSRELSSFFVAGINYKKTDAAVRGKFAVNNEQFRQMIQDAPGFGINEFIVLSTCNRTEIYGFASSVDNLSRLLCTQTEGSLQDFEILSYRKSGLFAIEHLFNVGAGLDSQILGDYEIIGQIKLAAKFAKENQCLGVYLERMINDVLQSSKKIRTTTALSGGTVSVSFAAVQCIKQQFPSYAGKKILLVGTGKIGSNTCKNLIDYLPGSCITLINRSEEKLIPLAEKYNLPYDTLNNLQYHIRQSDVILIATSAEDPIVLKEHLQGSGEKLIIDLSVPCNVEAGVSDYSFVKLIDVDQLSKIKDETLQMRAAEIPKVKIIIEEHINAFAEWHEMRKHVHVLQAVKSQLLKMHQSEGLYIKMPVPELSLKHTEQKIQKVINGMAVKLRAENTRGCHYLQALNDYMASSYN